MSIFVSSTAVSLRYKTCLPFKMVLRTIGINYDGKIDAIDKKSNISPYSADITPMYLRERHDAFPKKSYVEFLSPTCNSFVYVLRLNIFITILLSLNMIFCMFIIDSRLRVTAM